MVVCSRDCSTNVSGIYSCIPAVLADGAIAVHTGVPGALGWLVVAWARLANGVNVS